MVLQLKVNKRYNSRCLQNLFNYTEYKTTHFKLKILSKSSKQPIPHKKQLLWTFQSQNEVFWIWNDMNLKKNYISLFRFMRLSFASAYFSIFRKTEITCTDIGRITWWGIRSNLILSRNGDSIVCFSWKNGFHFSNWKWSN